MTMHNFEDSYKVGQLGEKLLDNYFSSKYKIENVTQAIEFKGIDRFYYKNQEKIAIEYKADAWTHKTGNIFIETMSNVETKRYGWAITSQADYIFYYLFKSEEIVCFSVVNMKSRLRKWLDLYRLQEVPNKRDGANYHSRGLLVPKDVLITELKAKVIKL